MKNIVLLLMIVMSISSCQFKQSKKTEQEVKTTPEKEVRIKLLWESDSLFKTPESVYFDEERQVYYVSNVNDNPWEKDGNGFISKLDKDGNLLDLNWVAEMDGPKGMGMIGNKLYVANLSELIEIDVDKGSITNRFEIEGEDGLNDICEGNGTEVFFTSSPNSIIYRFSEGEIRKINQSTENERYNGIIWQKDKLLFVTSVGGEFKSYDFKTSEVKTLAGGFGVSDGLAEVENGDYLISNWKGQLFYVDEDYNTVLMHDSMDYGMNTADFHYHKNERKLVVPTFFRNTIAVFQLFKD